MTSMEDEMQELREIVAQLRADNDRLHREREQVPGELPGPSTVNGVASTAMPDPPQPVETNFVGPERFICVPRDRRCPKFSGKSGIGVDEWVEEAEACMRVRYLSKADKAFFSSTTWKVKRGRRLGTVPVKNGEIRRGLLRFYVSCMVAPNHM